MYRKLQGKCTGKATYPGQWSGLRENVQEKPHIQWENRWFPVQIFRTRPIHWHFQWVVLISLLLVCYATLQGNICKYTGHRKPTSRFQGRSWQTWLDDLIYLLGAFLKRYQDMWPILVGGLVAIFYFPIYWVSNHPNWLSYFSEGWPNHQPVFDAKNIINETKLRYYTIDSLDLSRTIQNSWLTHSQPIKYPIKYPIQYFMTSPIQSNVKSKEKPLDESITIPKDRNWSFHHHHRIWNRHHFIQN